MEANMKKEADMIYGHRFDEMDDDLYSCEPDMKNRGRYEKMLTDMRLIKQTGG
jgi:hypothetical protein